MYINSHKNLKEGFKAKFCVVVHLCEVKLIYLPEQSRVMVILWSDGQMVIFEKSRNLIISFSTMVLKMLILMFDKINMSELECGTHGMDVSSNWQLLA